MGYFKRAEFWHRTGCLRCLLLVMCTYPFAKTALTLHLARGEGCENYFGCNLMQRKVLASSHQHLIAEAPMRLQQMPSDAKEILHESMHGQESLRLPRSFKLPHLSFPLSHRFVRDFG